MKTVSRCFFSLTMIIAGVSPLSACAYSGGPLDGRVLEEKTNKPIPGAIVVVRWQGTAFSFVDTHTVCLHVETVVTDSEGRFRIPFWHKRAEPALVRKLKPVIVAYKAGYDLPSAVSGKHGVEYLKPFKGERADRLEFLTFRMVSGTSCNNAGDSYKNLYRLRRAVYEEAAVLAQTPAEKERAERIKEIADDALVNRSKPTRYDDRGRLTNVDPKDAFRSEDLPWTK